MTQNKARRTNKIDFLQLPWAQEVWSSNLHAPTTYFFGFRFTLDAANSVGAKLSPTWARPESKSESLDIFHRAKPFFANLVQMTLARDLRRGTAENRFHRSGRSPHIVEHCRVTLSGNRKSQVVQNHTDDFGGGLHASVQDHLK